MVKKMIIADLGAGGKMGVSGLERKLGHDRRSGSVVLDIFKMENRIGSAGYFFQPRRT